MNRWASSWPGGNFHKYGCSFLNCDLFSVLPTRQITTLEQNNTADLRWLLCKLGSARIASSVFLLVSGLRSWRPPGAPRAWIWVWAEQAKLRLFWNGLCLGTCSSCFSAPSLGKEVWKLHEGRWLEFQASDSPPLCLQGLGPAPGLALQNGSTHCGTIQEFHFNYLKKSLKKSFDFCPCLPSFHGSVPLFLRD